MKYHKCLYVDILVIFYMNFPNIIQDFFYKSTRQRTPRVHDVVLVDENSSVGKRKLKQVKENY